MKPSASIEVRRNRRRCCLGFGMVDVMGWTRLQFVRSPARCPETAMQINFVRLDPELPVPTTGHIGDAAIDLHCREAVTLSRGERAAMPTGVAVAIPNGHAGLVLPRSGHARRLGVGVVNSPGLVDPGYRGEVIVMLINHGEETVHFERGDRIAQLAVVPMPAIEWVEVDRLDETSRGTGGFGSTGG